MKSILIGVSLCIIVTLAVVLSRGQVASLLVDTDDVVVLHADENGHFFGDLNINGVTLKYMVDSGASNVTMNSADAIKAGIDYAKGQQVGLLTPGGELQAFSLKLNALMIGATVLNNVEVTVVEGESPPYVLLGISAQKKLDLKRDNAIMTLGRKD